MKTNLKQITFGLLVAVSGGGLLPSAKACTRVFLNKDPQQMIVGRTMDLYLEDHPRIVHFPKGVERSGATISNAVHWVSKYASIGVTSLDACNSDGLNEKGLAAHLLYLHGSEYATDNGSPAISNVSWAQYVLDNYATVTEALEGLAKVQVISRAAAGREWPLHLAMEDATGDSAIIEYVKGKMVVHHGKEFTVMGNEPVFEEQLANLKKYKLFGGNLAMPGDIDPLARFVRASSFLKTLPKPQTDDEAVAFVGGVMRTTMAPFGAVDTSGSQAEDAWPTRWVTLSDLSHKRMYFLATNSPNVVWLDMDKLAASPDLLALSPTASLAGEISGQLTKFTPNTKEYPPAH